MTEIIIGQVRFVLVTLCLGMTLMFGYDLWRFVRWVIPHHKVVVWVEDILYWLVIRWYGALAVFLGGILYEKGISSVLRRFGRNHLDKPKRKLFQWISKVWKYFGVRKQLKKAREKVSIRRKRALKSLGK